jgi:hypothetical protein
LRTTSQTLSTTPRRPCHAPVVAVAGRLRRLATSSGQGRPPTPDGPGPTLAPRGRFGDSCHSSDAITAIHGPLGAEAKVGDDGARVSLGCVGWTWMTSPACATYPRAARSTSPTERELIGLRARSLDLLHRDGIGMFDEPFALGRTRLEQLPGDLAVPHPVIDDRQAAQRIPRREARAGSRHRREASVPPPRTAVARRPLIGEHVERFGFPAHRSDSSLACSRAGMNERGGMSRIAVLSAMTAACTSSRIAQNDYPCNQLRGGASGSHKTLTSCGL